MTSTKPNNPETSSVVPLYGVLVMVTPPVVSAVITSEFVVNGPILPEPLSRFNVAPMMVPAVCVIVPALVAVRETDVGPVKSPLTTTEPLPADVEAMFNVVAPDNTPVVMF